MSSPRHCDAVPAPYLSQSVSQSPQRCLSRHLVKRRQLVASSSDKFQNGELCPDLEYVVSRNPDRDRAMHGSD